MSSAGGGKTKDARAIGALGLSQDPGYQIEITDSGNELTMIKVVYLGI